MIRPVILCGGKGSRLWPLSREFYPKQYIALTGSQTLFQQTVGRMRLIDTLPPISICNAEHRFYVAEQLQQMGIESDIILEPISRNTAPALAVCALKDKEEDPLLLIMPSDHYIPDNTAFAAAVERACPLAENGKLVVFGVTPDSPKTGFGYIRKGTVQGNGFLVDAFVEKPDAETAQKYLNSGEYYWNSGMFLFKASVMLEELEKYAPEILSACQEALTAGISDLDFFRLDAKAFKKAPSISIDYAVMEKSERMAMVTLDTQWNDLGSWDALYDIGEKDESDNVIMGDVLTKDVQRCLLHSRNKLITAVGVEDLVVVETKDAILISKKDQVQDVKNVVDTLRDQNRNEAYYHPKVYRPWGSYEGTDCDERFQVKRLSVKPGEVLSLQKHHHRSEHWVVVKGTAKITNGDKEFLLTEDQSTYIPVGKVHRLANPGCIPLELIEVQTGSYLGEDDIVRFEDVYGREKG